MRGGTWAAAIAFSIAACNGDGAKPAAAPLPAPTPSAPSSANAAMIEDCFLRMQMNYGTVPADCTGVIEPVKIPPVDLSDAGPLTPAPAHGEARGDVTRLKTTSEPATFKAERVVASLRPRFRQCYRKALDDKTQNGGGDVVIGVIVAANGEVSGAAPHGGSGIAKGAIDCMIHVLKNAQFDAPGGVATVLIEATFTP